MTEPEAAPPGAPDEEPPRPARRLRLDRIFAWQSGLVLFLMAISSAVRWGSPAGIASGAGVMGLSILLQAWATRAALGRHRRPALAMGLFTLKLGLLIAVAALGLGRVGLPPMSFAAGATTLLVAIVIDTCYEDAMSRRARG